jgi:phosphoribosylformylglycinamidine cyclo-ligase
MYRVFNMGIGLILIVPAGSAEALMARAMALGDRAFLIGEMVARGEGASDVEYVD